MLPVKGTRQPHKQQFLAYSIHFTSGHATLTLVTYHPPFSIATQYGIKYKCCICSKVFNLCHVLFTMLASSCECLDKVPQVLTIISYSSLSLLWNNVCTSTVKHALNWCADLTHDSPLNRWVHLGTAWHPKFAHLLYVEVVSWLANTCNTIMLASFPALPLFSYCSMQKGEGKPGPFYHMNGVSIYILRKRSSF